MVDQAPPSLIEPLLLRVRGEFLEMPGLRLNAGQARRLWALDEAVCEGVLTRLVDAAFLVRDRDGRYRRPSAERMSPLRMASAGLAMTDAGQSLAAVQRQA